ncbi:peptide-methionine (S)-S-oxide reductase [Egibacter rhizosphaerae]|uniref:Peptide methionine sulfoxide reductase MsrA n=2 Tax=Egibacter rhizosphaerae TaxID=1670831 RepID=A0A411YKY3_9ACTN|nr:peptide-methionine (S)-S-oxide reductase [Egibacter rhizosphaerae]
MTAEAMFGAGCFWGVEVTFRNVPGVTDVRVGYAGGTTPQPTYEQVCRGDTGHAEVVRVTYDPSEVSYDRLLDTFLEAHDPTQVNRQGPDVGSQYRSVVFVADEAEQGAAEKAVARHQQRFDAPIATQIDDDATFWPAEDYHQQYLVKRGLASCRI